MKDGQIGDTGIFAGIISAITGFSAKRWLAERGRFARARFAGLVAALRIVRREDGRVLPVVADGDRRKVGPVPAVLINLCVPGAAQLLCDQILKGLAYMAVYYTLCRAVAAAWVPMALAVVICAETLYTVKGMKSGREVLRMGFFR